MIYISFKLSAEHVKGVLSGITDSKFGGSVTVGADKYILVRNDPGSFVILKKGTSGIVGYKTNQSKSKSCDIKH